MVLSQSRSAKARLWLKELQAQLSFPRIAPKKNVVIIVFLHQTTTSLESINMSAASKATLAATSLSAIGIIIFVHYGQKVEKAVCQELDCI